MSLRSVRVELHCDKKNLKFNHDIDSRLVGEAAMRPDQAYQVLFKSTLDTILEPHFQDCMEASARYCFSGCGKPSATLVVTPMSWLHRSDDPHIVIFMVAVCEHGGKCENQARKEVKELIAETGPGEEGELLTCHCCGKMEGVARCGRCRLISYCGKECQRADWKRHKRVCKPSQ